MKRYSHVDADMVAEQLRALIDPDKYFVQGAMQSFGRTIELTIIRTSHEGYQGWARFGAVPFAQYSGTKEIGDGVQYVEHLPSEENLKAFAERFLAETK